MAIGSIIRSRCPQQTIIFVQFPTRLLQGSYKGAAAHPGGRRVDTGLLRPCAKPSPCHFFGHSTSRGVGQGAADDRARKGGW